MNRIKPGLVYAWMSRHRWFLAIGLIYFILGFATGFYMNNEGIGVSPDSVTYIASVHSLIADDGQ